MAVMYTKRETRVHHERVFVGRVKSEISEIFTFSRKSDAERSRYDNIKVFSSLH